MRHKRLFSVYWQSLKKFGNFVLFYFLLWFFSVFLYFYFYFYYIFIFATWVVFNGVCWLILLFFFLLKIVVVFLQRDEEKFYMTRLLELGLVETVDKKIITSGSPSGKSYCLSSPFPHSLGRWNASGLNKLHRGWIVCHLLILLSSGDCTYRWMCN